MNNRLNVLVTSFLIATSGCTTGIGLTSDIRTKLSSDAVPGVTYALPMTQFELKVSRTLSQCEGPKISNGKVIYRKDKSGTFVTDDKGNKIPEKVDEIAFSVTTKAEENFVPGETYILDHRALSAATKVSSIAMEFHDETQTLKSINAGAEDKTGEVIKNSARTLVGVASIASGIPFPIDSAASSSHDYLVCTSTTKKSLANLKAASVLLKIATQKLTDKTKELEEEVASISKIGGATSLSQSQKDRLSQLGVEQRLLMISVAAATENLDKIKKPLSQETIIKWPQTFSDLQSPKAHPFELNDDERKKWKNLFEAKEGIDIKPGGKQFCLLSVPQNRSQITSNEQTKRNIEISSCLKQSLSISAALIPLVDNSASINDAKKISISNDPDKPSTGFVYRPPESGRLRVCHKIDSSICASGSTTDNIILNSENPILIPQLGQLRFLEFNNEPFQNNQMKFELGTNGALKKFEYKELNAQAEIASAATADLVTQIGTFLTTQKNFKEDQKTEREEEEKSKLDAAKQALVDERNAQKATLQFEIDTLTLQKELLLLTSPVDTTSLTAINTEVEELQAKISLNQAKLSLLQTQADLDAF